MAALHRGQNAIRAALYGEMQKIVELRDTRIRLDQAVVEIERMRSRKANALNAADRGYEMWFSDVSKRPWIYRHASSNDGTKWTVTPKPVLYLSQDWEAEVLVYPTVLKVDNAYLMWYGSYDRAIRRETTAIGFAASLDGLTWHKNPSNPVLRPDPSRPWESNYVGSGCVLHLADGSFRYWYASRKAPPFLNLYFAINTARWSGPPAGPSEANGK
jgi:hypothetical protein